MPGLHITEVLKLSGEAGGGNRDHGSRLGDLSELEPTGFRHGVETWNMETGVIPGIRGSHWEDFKVLTRTDVEGQYEQRAGWGRLKKTI